MFNNENLTEYDLIARNIVNGILTIPKNVVEITKKMGDIIVNFNVEHIQFEHGSVLKSVADKALFKNVTIKSIDFSNCKELEFLGKSCLEQMHKLKTVHFGKKANIQEIKDRALFDTGITQLDLSNSNIEKIGSQIVGHCKNLHIIDFSNCKHLTTIAISGLANCLIHGQYDLIDLAGCNNITYWGHHCINTKLAKFDYGITAPIRDNTFYNSFMGNNIIEIWDKNKKVFDFNSDETNFAHIQPLSLGLLKYAHSLGYEPNPPFLINIPVDKREVKLMAKDYRKEIDNITKSVNGVDGYAVVNMLRQLGFFGFSNKLEDKKIKNEINIYKNLLAKDYLKHNPPQEILECKDKKIIEEILQRKTNKIARKMEIKDLVLEFVNNNILSSMYRTQIINEFAKMTNPPLIDLKFAEFFVYNFDKIVEEKIKNINELTLTDYSQDKKINLTDIHNRFSEILDKTNKKVITRSDQQRLTLDDCEFDCLYDNILAGNDKIASLCGANHISQDGFEFLQQLFMEGKKIADKQILISKPDNVASKFHYEIIDKCNPIGLVLGNITSCCQAYDGNAQQCVELGYTNPNCSFVAFKEDEKIIGQSYLWYDGKTKTLALDNIEIPDVHNKRINREHSKEMLETILRFCKNTKDVMDSNGHEIKNIIIGKNATDLEILKDICPLETDKKKMFDCPIKIGDETAYTDVLVEGQYVVCKDGKFLKRDRNKNLNEIQALEVLKKSKQDDLER